MVEYQIQRSKAWESFQWHTNPSSVVPHSIWAHATPTGLLSWMYNALPWGVLIVSGDGRVLYYNRAYARLRHFPMGAWLGHPVEVFDRRRAVRELLQTGTLPSERPLSNDRRKHREIIFPIRQDGLLAGVVVMIVPANERRDHTGEQSHQGALGSLHDEVSWSPPYTFADIIGCSPALVQVREAARQAAQTGASVLLVGEAGTGKTLLARAIHAASARQRCPFVPVDCASLPPERLEAELFGGTAEQVSGFERAQGGTVFLKALDALPLSMQTRLFRVLQERQLRRAGTRLVPVTCTVIAAAERDLAGLVAQGRFRQDLWYRIGVIQLEVPPLRERPTDIPLLIEHYWERKRQELGRQAHLSTAALQVLEAYPWPGNVRELVDVVERLLKMPRKLVIEPKDLPGSVLAEAERCTLERALQQAQGNRVRAAQLIGVSRTSLYRKLKVFGLLKPGGVQALPDAQAKPQSDSLDA